MESSQDSSVVLQDPWTPQSPPLPDANDSLEGFGTFEFDPLESKQYLESLETRLKYLKGKTREPTAKDMLKCLGQVKEGHMKTIIDDSQTPYVSNHDPDEPVPQDHPTIAALQRRIHPERQALTVQELRKLVENDDLNKMTRQVLSQPTESETSHTSQDNNDDDKDTDTAQGGDAGRM